MKSSATTRASGVKNPDLDWSQVHETVLMLNLAVAQIEGTLKGGDESVNTLADSFTSMVDHVETVSKTARKLEESEEKSTISEICSAVSHKMREAIIAFQFYDKLTQRLTHLSNSLESLASLVSQPENLYNPHAWQGLQEQIKSQYTVESDKAMFDAILSGKSVHEALLQCEKLNLSNNDDEDVELF